MGVCGHHDSYLTHTILSLRLSSISVSARCVTIETTVIRLFLSQWQRLGFPKNISCIK